MNRKIEHDPSKKYPRVQAALKGQSNGPTIVAIAGLHGNEPAGVIAAEKFIDSIRDVDISGEFVSIVGHIEALSLRKRYISKDLNRIWDEETIARVRNSDCVVCPEEKQQKEILEVIDGILRNVTGPIIFFDIHTTSANGPAFTFIEDGEECKNLVSDLHVPNLLGLEAKVNGTFINYIHSLGHRIIAYEAGQNDLTTSIDNALAFLWIMSHRLGLLSSEQVDLQYWQKLLADSCSGLPRFLRIEYRHRIAPGDNFKMEPGYTIFQVIKKGELLAKDKNGPITAPISGRILFPLYQGQGNDGFFIVKEEL